MFPQDRIKRQRQNPVVRNDTAGTVAQSRPNALAKRVAGGGKQKPVAARKRMVPTFLTAADPFSATRDPTACTGGCLHEVTVEDSKQDEQVSNTGDDVIPQCIPVEEEHNGCYLLRSKEFGASGRVT